MIFSLQLPMLYLTTCCKEKSKTPLPCPAIERYLDPRIRQVYAHSQADKTAFGILSGKYGLLHPDDLIDWYDKKLELSDIPDLLPLLLRQLKDQQVHTIHFFAKSPDVFPEWKPYCLIVEQAVAELGIELVFLYY